MSSPVIQAEGIGKRYILGPGGGNNDKLRHAIGSGLRSLGERVRRPRRASAPDRNEFWALRDVSFDIHQGDRVGIIGRNGAGKSTLLKVLSRITEPTEGRMRIRGRIASLLEVGTGFHPELTGRENIYLNGAILGMTRVEIRRKFDEIVDFAEVERFLDTPVKRYSSGMYVRLAFAVAAHLEPEILVVDEVLAVGDAQFQKKCLGKMQEVGAEGRTVIFVSHQMNAIEQLCSRAILLQGGRITQDSSDVRRLIREYMSGGFDETVRSVWVGSGERDFESEWLRPLRFALTDQDRLPLQFPISNDRDIWVEIQLEVLNTDPALCVGYALYTDEGTLLYWSYQTDTVEDDRATLQPGIVTLRSRIPMHFLNEGSYRLDLAISLHYRQWLCEPGVKAPSLYFNIQGGLSNSSYWISKRPGELAPIFDWEVQSGSNVAESGARFDKTEQIVG